ncbi:hypothetical protein FE257_006883 [Aspergillus nanangensis]|uniref:Uncharacterized protein n=1 Tax=Aspergillus nanangensis TaxID=2582783 RepID=A0AAD4CP27_ASPNN|nr:hypothetical protein FE257_006883 [Aspergillus nanangensis]
MPPNLGSATGDLSNDDYVAAVLAREARDSSLKYSVQGMGAYMPTRPTGTAPKPNTRFLRNIIKETDNHNTALKRKEDRDARERMRQLRNKASSFMGESQSHRHHRSDTQDSRRDREDREDRHRSRRRRHRSRSASADRERSSKHRRKHASYESDKERHRSSRKSRQRRSYSRSRSQSPLAEDGGRPRRHRRRSVSPSRSRSRSPDTHDRKRHRHSGHSTRRRTSREPHNSSQHSRRTSGKPSLPSPENRQSHYESDPLEDLVGPLPAKGEGSRAAEPIRSRGRNAYKANLSNIDAHFAADYDPTLDVELDVDDLDTRNKPTRRPVAGLMTGDDDWGVSLEALRDRTHWKKKGEERLREAGFNDAFVERWKTNTTPAAAADSESRVEDVKWSKKGEGREWDRGKFVDDEGHIDVKAPW